MIEPVAIGARERVPRATAICDGCGRRETMTCDYELISANSGWRPNEGQIVRKLTGHGWRLVKRTLLCPTCAAARKVARPAIPNPQEKQEPPMQTAETVVPLRQPTRDIIYRITELLMASYDRAAGRYNDGDTDKTVAEAVGGGVPARLGDGRARKGVRPRWRQCRDRGAAGRPCHGAGRRGCGPCPHA